MDESWTLKYTPKLLSNMIGNKLIISRFEQMVEDNKIPNMIITGSSGVGKTISIINLTKQFHARNGSEIIFINGSEIRSVDIVKTKIIVLGQKVVPNNKRRIMVIDEADSVQVSIQQTLRRLIEEYSHKISFIFICNSLCKMIEPIQSRCAIFNFTRLSDKQIADYIETLCQNEQITYSKGGLDAIVLISNGDIRFAINNTEAIVRTFKTLNQRSVYKLCDLPHPQIILKILKGCQTRDITLINKLITMLWKDGYSAIDIVTSMFQIIKQTDQINEMFRIQCIMEIGKTHIDIVDGGNTRLQLMGMCIRMSDMYHTLGENE